jgi:hypothetical protein
MMRDQFKIYESADSLAALQEGASCWVLALIRPGKQSLALVSFNMWQEADTFLRALTPLSAALLIADWYEGQKGKP